MKTFIVVVLSTFFSTLMMGQAYDLAAGIRVGKGLGPSVTYRYYKGVTAEAFAFANVKSGYNVGLLTSYHGKIVFQKRLNWYLGGGLHFGKQNDTATYGAAMHAGAEMSINKINAGVEYLLFNNIPEGLPTFEPSLQLVVRYVILGRSKKRYIPKWKIKI